MIDGLNIQKIGAGYFIFDGARQISGACGSFGQAETRLQGIRQQRRQEQRSRVRPCLTCGQKFRSEGPHNRMCNPCRHAKSGLDPQMMG